MFPFSDISTKNKKSNANLEKEVKKMAVLADELANQKLDMKRKQEELRVSQMQETYLMQLINGSSSSRWQRLNVGDKGLMKRLDNVFIKRMKAANENLLIISLLFIYKSLNAYNQCMFILFVCELLVFDYKQNYNLSLVTNSLRIEVNR